MTENSPETVAVDADRALPAGGLQWPAPAALPDAAQTPGHQSGPAESAPSLLRFRGFVDEFDPAAGLIGWAYDPQGDGALDILLTDGGKLVAHASANGFRQDLLDAGLGDGNCAFHMPIPPALFDSAVHTLRVYAARQDYRELIHEAADIVLPRFLFADRREYAASLLNNTDGRNEDARLAALIETCHALVSLSSRHDFFTSNETAFAAVLLRAFLNDIERSQFDFARLSCFDSGNKLRLLDLLTNLGEDRALRYVMAAMPVGAHEQKLRDRIVGYLFAGHAGGWYANIGFFAEKQLLNSGTVQDAARHFQPDSSLFRQLKAYETAFLREHRRWYTVSGLIQHLRQHAEPDASVVEDSTPGLDPPIFAQRALFVQHPVIKALTALCLFAPGFMRDMLRHLNDTEINDLFKSAIPGPPVYLIVTDVSYPMGGGESFMYQTCKILSELGFICVWVSHRAAGSTGYEHGSVTQTPYFLDVRESAALSTASIERHISHYSADILHTQGKSNSFGLEASERTRIPVVTGFHFWDGLVTLGRTGNSHILVNAQRHRLGPLFKQFRAALCTPYVASEFMAEVVDTLGANQTLAVCHPTSDASHYGGGIAYDPDARRGVLQLNIHDLKGGRILLAAIRALGHGIPFVAVRTEPGSESVDLQIRQAIAELQDSEYLHYSDVKTLFAKARIVLVPTLVDETFCRVAYEAAMNRIPVLCTRNGFLPYLLGDSGVYLSEDPADWVAAIAGLYNDPVALARISAAQYAYVSQRFTEAPASFLSIFAEALQRAPRRNIGFIAPWAEQGLGIQVRHYAALLRGLGYRVHILSFQPYGAMGRSVTLHESPEEWQPGLHADTVHYSLNIREELTDHEIRQFLTINNVGVLIYPEVCWDTNWDKLRRLSMVNLFTACVPNIETVRRQEVPYHTLFSRILCNTRVCENMFLAHGITHTHYIGHGYGEMLDQAAVSRKLSQLDASQMIRFVHVAGHNPHTRKQTRKVINAFRMALLQRDDIELVVSVMANWDRSDAEAFPDKIRVINRPLSHAQILDLYRTAHVSIQISSHEGLGLGFYESISMLTPVVSLDTPPHNEIVRDGITGWLLPAERRPLPDNDDAVFYAAHIDEHILANAIASITPAQIATRIRDGAAYYNQHFASLRLQIRLFRGIW